MIVYISIGNSDDKLTQARWAEYVLEVGHALGDHSVHDDPAVTKTHGAWLSSPDSPWQNACWCVEVWPPAVDELKGVLTDLAERFDQDSIAWAEAPMTEFLAPTKES